LGWSPGWMQGDEDYLKYVAETFGLSAPWLTAPFFWVLNFGIPVMTGKQASSVNLTKLERDISNAIKRFEPRILADSLEVRAFEPEDVLGTHNVIEFEIKGRLWAQPVPLDVLYRTRLDLEAGIVNVRDVTLADAEAPPQPGQAG
ncbi:MAG: hypothetical protein EOP39_14020, partial [Rubrivivax sp.]